jgi:hypothetical protein
LVKSTIRTVRIDEDLNEAMEKIATENNTSVNFVVNNALREHVEWTSVVPKLGFGTYPHYLINKLFEKLSEMECEEMGEITASKFTNSFLQYRFGSASLENWIRIAREFSKHAGGFRFLAETRKQDRETIVIFEHGSGIKWSHFFKGVVQHVGESLGMDVKTELNENKCTARLSSRSVIN